MAKRTFAILLILLTAFQSLVTAADIHQMHQDGVQHMEFEDHDHSHGQLSDKETADSNLVLNIETPADEPDCHHCCHCHRSSGYTIDGILPFASTPLLAKPAFFYLKKHLPIVLSSLLRPPIF